MKRPFKKPITKASPDIKVEEPKISKFVIFLTKLFGRLYLFFFLGIARIQLNNEKILFDVFQRALAGKSRCIIGFRHPNGGEPQILIWFFLFKLRAWAARKGVKFARQPHTLGLYGYEVIRWGGWVAKLIMPNLGALPVYHSRVDRQGMDRINKALVNGPYPLILAPEGHVSYVTDSAPRLEPGTIRIGFRAAKQLRDMGSDCPVEILPLSIHYRYGPWGRMGLKLLLKKIEKVCGLAGGDRAALPFSRRVDDCRRHVLKVNELRFKLESDESLSFEERLERVVWAALETAERMLGLKAEGEFFPRFYKVRQMCWDRIFLPDIESFAHLSQVEQGVLDVQTGEGWYIARYEELIDICWHFRVPLPADDVPFHDRVEYAQNLWDFASRTMGGSYSNRASIFPKKVVVNAAPVINLSERLPAYKESKKEAIAAAMEDLEKTFLHCVEEVKTNIPK
ncbi:MAG: acyltransferase [Spirochaetes bacterium]|nr:acyltransferase [Spirochaetota bacterium]